MSNAIEVVNLEKTYVRFRRPPVRALDGLTFSVPSGGIFGLLGPNGAGKSTTIRILTTLIKPTGGHAAVAGVDVLKHPLDVRRRISVVIQEQASELFLTVRDNLVTYARFHGLRGTVVDRRVDEVLEQFGLQKEAGRKTQDLSGGYRRRVQVAKTFLVDTPILFLDEFSTGMDTILKRSVMDLLRGAAKKGRTIVLTTHILHEAEELCDDLLIISGGREVARGDMQSLKQSSGGTTLEDVFVRLMAEEAEEGAK